MFEIGQIVNEENYTEAAVFCNKLQDRHIAIMDGVYTIVENAPAPEPTTEEKVRALENETGLNRAVRELVLSDNSGASEYVKGKAQEIEDLAQELRATDGISATDKENLQVEETEKVN